MRYVMLCKSGNGEEIPSMDTISSVEIFCSSSQGDFLFRQCPFRQRFAACAPRLRNSFDARIARDDTADNGAVGVYITTYACRQPESFFVIRNLFNRTPDGKWNRI